MDYRELLVGVLSGIGTSAVLTALAIAKGWLSITGPARRFWKIPPDDEVHIVMSLPQPVPDEHTVYVPTGDSLALGAITGMLKRLYPRVRFTFHRNVEQPLTDWNRTVVLIGGGKSNLTARWLLAALDPPVHGFDHRFPPDYDPKGFIVRDDEKVQLEPTFEGEVLSEDIGFVIRAPNPSYPKKWVFIFVGSYSHGTHGAANWATEPHNLLWLWWHELRRARSKTDSVEVVLRVPAEGRLSRLEIPLLGETRVWNHLGVATPYYFDAPAAYGGSYKKMILGEGHSDKSSSKG